MQTRASPRAAGDRPGSLYTLTSRHGVEVAVTDLGARLVSVRAPDRRGDVGDVVLGHDDDEPTRWTAYDVARPDSASITFVHVGAAGAGRQPGTIAVDIRYTLTERGELTIDCTATTDRPTIVDLPTHACFNLGGGDDVLGHQLWLAADRVAPRGPRQVDASALRAVHGTPFDFTRAVAIGERVAAADPELARHGYDHAWVLHRRGAPAALAAEVHDPRSGRVLQVATTEPGIHVATGHRHERPGRGGRGEARRVVGVCLATRRVSAELDRAGFPATALQPGAVHRSTTIYRFSVRS